MKNRMIYRYIIFFLFLFIASLSSTAGAQGPKYGGIVRIGVLFPQYNNLDGRQWLPYAFVPANRMIYDPIFQWGAKGFEEPEPCLATHYETKDNIEWIFHLRKGVKFHNDREMTAEDVTANLSWRLETPKGWEPIGNKHLFRTMKKVETLEKYKVKVTMNRPFSTFPRLITQAIHAIVPPEEAKKWNKDFWKHATGTGPFKLVIAKPNESVVLERFDGYWGPKPYIDRIEYYFIRNDDARLSALEKGEIDVAHLIDANTSDLEGNPDLAYYDWPLTGVLERLWFNHRRWPMNDNRFRMAVWMGADWKNIIIDSYAHQSGKFSRTYLEFSKYFNQEAVDLVPSYNPEKAKKLIQALEKETGKKIPSINFLDANTPIRKKQAEMAKKQLAEIGIKLKLDFHSRAIWTNSLNKDKKLKWDIGKLGSGFSADPFQGFTHHMTDSGSGIDGKALDGYSNPDFDQWIERAMALVEEEKIIKCYQEAEKVLLMDAANIPLHPLRQIMAFNKKVKGIKPNNLAAFYTTTTFENWWIEK